MRKLAKNHAKSQVFLGLGKLVTRGWLSYRRMDQSGFAGLSQAAARQDRDVGRFDGAEVGVSPQLLLARQLRKHVASERRHHFAQDVGQSGLRERAGLDQLLDVYKGRFGRDGFGTYAARLLRHLHFAFSLAKKSAALALSRI